MKTIVPNQKPAPAAAHHESHASTGEKPAWEYVAGGPPPDIADNELVHMLMAMPRPHSIEPYPRKLPGGVVISHLAIVAAMPDDKMMAIAAAHNYARKLLSDPKKSKEEGITKLSPEDIASRGYVQLLQNEATIQLLVRMCKKVRRKPGAQGHEREDYELALNRDGKLQDAFPGPAFMRLHCPDDEIAVLIATYSRVQLKIGPIVSELSEQACDLWLEKLIAGGVASDPLDSLGSDARADLVMRSVFHHRNCRKGNCSFGVPRASGWTGSGSSGESSSPAEDEVTPPPDEDVIAPEVSEFPVDPFAEPEPAPKK